MPKRLTKAEQLSRSLRAEYRRLNYVRRRKLSAYERSVRFPPFVVRLLARTRHVSRPGKAGARGPQCRALTTEEISAVSGLTSQQVCEFSHLDSWVKIIRARKVPDFVRGCGADFNDPVWVKESTLLKSRLAARVNLPRYFLTSPERQAVLEPLLALLPSEGQSKREERAEFRRSGKKRWEIIGERAQRKRKEREVLKRSLRSTGVGLVSCSRSKSAVGGGGGKQRRSPGVAAKSPITRAEGEEIGLRAKRIREEAAARRKKETEDAATATAAEEAATAATLNEAAPPPRPGLGTHAHAGPGGLL